MRTLLVDAGNTRLKWGVLELGEIHETGHVFMADLEANGIATIATRLPRDLERAMVSNVAGQSFATRLTGLLGAHCGADVRFAKTAANACGVVNAYDDPRQMGVDRWLAMIGGWAEFRRCLLVVDAGTAVTLDAIDNSGQHLGGQIFPGLGLMAGVLGRETSDIPGFEGPGREASRSLAMFGASTEDCVIQGSSNAVCGAIERAISVLRSSAYDPVLVLTGGDASAILGALETAPEHRPDLVLAGLRELLDHER